MNTKHIGYWAATGLTAFAMGSGGVLDLSGAPEVVGIITHLGYPAYLVPLLGFWKLLATAALLAPGLPRLKEWAYAGIIFDLTGAAYSHAKFSGAIGEAVPPLVLTAIVMASWALRPAGRRLEAGPTPEAEGRVRRGDEAPQAA